MWSVIVEMALVRVEHHTGVAFVVDQHPVRALGADTADEPLGITVRPRRSGWGLDDLDVLGREHGVERAAELGVSVPEQEPAAADPITEPRDEVAGLLDGPLRRGMGGDAEEVHPPGRDLHHAQHIQPPQDDRVQMEEVGCEQPGRLGTQEGPPAGVDVAGRGPEPAGGEDPADRAGADPVPEADQLCLDPSVPPAGILPGRPEDKVTDLALVRGRPGRFG